MVSLDVHLPHDLLEPGFGRDPVHRSPREGGLDKLKGKKIAHVFLSVPYGKEANPILDTLSRASSGSS